MNSLNPLEPDYSEFVEVDPTGRYGRYDEILGKGSSKTVYRAFDEFEGIEVAWNQVKLYDFLRSPEDLERLYCEIHLLKTLKHNNIMKFYTSWVDTSNRNINFVTEMFTSGTLRQYREKHKRVNIRAVKHWCRQILRGLLYLHSHDPPVIHRDLKCDNIFVNGNQGEVKIGDLGLAAILRKSHSSHCVGTPEFMAPEVYEEEYNELVDIYSFGMCILEMVTFEYPYSECTHPAQIYKKVISGKKPDALYKVKDREVREFVEKCLAASCRRLSAGELLADPFLQVDDYGADLRPTEYMNRYDMDPFLSRPLYELPQNGRSSLSNGYSLDFDPNHGIEPEHGWYHLVEMENNGIELFTYHEDEHSPNVDITIKGRKKEDDSIFLRVRIADKEDRIRNIFFPFDIETDTAFGVATEMVAELDITDQDVTRIADTIDGEIFRLVPEWKPGPGIEAAPRFGNGICHNCASTRTSNGSLIDYHSLNNLCAGNDLQVFQCQHGCAEMHGRFEEITYQVEGSDHCVADGPDISTRSEVLNCVEIWAHQEGPELSSVESGEPNSDEEHGRLISSTPTNGKCVTNLVDYAGRNSSGVPSSACAFFDDYESEIRHKLRWLKAKYQMELGEFKNLQLGRKSRHLSVCPDTENWRNTRESRVLRRIHSGKDISSNFSNLQISCPDSENQTARSCGASMDSSPEFMFTAKNFYTELLPNSINRTTSLPVDAVDV